MTEAAPIPVIDLTGTDRGGARREAVAKALVDAAVEHGFVYIRNSGLDIPVDAVNGAFDISRKLFSLPSVEKEPCRIQTNNRGWAAMRAETLDPKTQKIGDPKEVFNIGEFVDGKAQQPLPASLKFDEPKIGAFFDLCYHLCLKLNDLLGIGLEVNPPDFFTAAHRKECGASNNTLRLLYYPPRGASGMDDDDIRAGAHTDYGSLTLLFRLPGQAGLQIRTRDDSWVPVPVVPQGSGVEGDATPPILVNIGDLLAYWTSGLLRSTVHRVAFPAVKKGADAASNGEMSLVPGETTGEPRYSIAFFCHPVGTSPLTPVPSVRVEQAVAERRKAKAAAAAASDSLEGEAATAAPESKVLTANEHLRMRLRATFLDLY